MWLECLDTILIASLVDYVVRSSLLIKYYTYYIGINIYYLYVLVLQVWFWCSPEVNLTA